MLSSLLSLITGDATSYSTLACGIAGIYITYDAVHLSRIFS